MDLLWTRDGLIYGPTRALLGLRVGLRGSETTRGAGRGPLIVALGSLRPSVGEHEPAGKRFAGSSRATFMAIEGVEGPKRTNYRHVGWAPPRARAPAVLSWESSWRIRQSFRERK